MPEEGLALDAGARLAGIAAALGYRLHEAGLPVTPERSRQFARAVALAEPTSLQELYWLGRATLLTSHDQQETYDRIFREVFRGIVDIGNLDPASRPTPPTSTAGSQERAPGTDHPPQDSAGSPQGTSQTPGGSASDDQREASALAAVSEAERLNDREFSQLTDAELEIIRHLIERLPVIPPLRQARRTRRDSRGLRLDVRATLRGSYRTAGDPVLLTHRSRTAKPRRVILIADVSGSMEPYARVYLHLMRGAVLALRAEAFVFATRLTWLTRSLQITDPDAAYRKVAGEARDWSGGTRIGQSLKDFIDMYGRRGLARGSVIVIVSDGWELGEPDLVRESMERLARLAHHVIWVNPRKAAQDYQPLVGGMAAALPYVDTFVSGHSYRALQDVLDAIAAAQHRSTRGLPRVA